MDGPAIPLRSLRVAKASGIASVLEIPTWHRDKEKPRRKSRVSKHEKNARFRRSCSRVFSSAASKASRNTTWPTCCLSRPDAPPNVLGCGHSRGKALLAGCRSGCRSFSGGAVDPAKPILGQASNARGLLRSAHRRKGVHVLLEAWHKLSLPNAQLTLVGSIHDEIRPCLSQFAGLR